MTQFDVWRNPSGRTSPHIPYLLEVQSDALSAFPRRVMVPLVPTASIQDLDAALNPVFEIETKPCTMLPTDIASLPVSVLHAWVTSLVPEGDRIIRALDELMARY